jgi:SAM-dependent methyltransferase
MSPTLRDYIVFSSQLLTGYRTRWEYRNFSECWDDIEFYLGSSIPLKILDLANGQLRPQFQLLKNRGHKVYGIDLVNKSDFSWLGLGYRFARWIYSTHLQGRPSDSHNDLLVCGDVATLPFRNDFFDLISSVAAFEHFLDVPAVVEEIYRVLRLGGLAKISIHLFTSPSGGHNINISQVPLVDIPNGVEPWDHLRKRRLPITVPLNEWRIHQYLEAFSGHFEILKHYCAMREGEHLLTPEIEAELADYSRDELTCGAYVIVARKH